MAKVIFKGLNPDQFKGIMKAKVEQKLEATAIIVKNEMKTQLSKKDNLKGTKDSGASAGDFPYKVTGQLAGSISHNVDAEKLTAKVGSNLSYAKWLQRGTRYMAARPFLTLTMNAIQGTLKRIWGK